MDTTDIESCERAAKEIENYIKEESTEELRTRTYI
jgi:hypothetical protein